MPTPSPNDFAPPETVEGCRVGALLRSSGALAVHAGRSKLELPVEISFVRTSALTGGFEPDDMLAVVRRAAAVHHEALLPYLTGGRSAPGDDASGGGYVFAVAKTAEGNTLGDLVAKDGPLPEAKALALATSIAGALAALERAGMRHGDLAPQRIVRMANDQWMLCPPRLVPASISPRAERWQAPEEARGAESGVQSDLFALGLVLAFALNGGHLLAETADARRSLRDWKTPDLALALRRAGDSVRAVVARLLAPEPANRFPTAADALRAIQEAAASPGDRIATAPIGKPLADPPRRPPGRLYVDARLGACVLDIDDASIHVGPLPGRMARAQAEPFDGAVARIERTPSGDVVHALSPELTVNGAKAASKPLADGDVIAAPEFSARYERAAAPARATAPAAPARSPMAAVVFAVAVVGTIAALGWGAWTVLQATGESANAKAMADRSRSALDEEKRRHAPAQAPAQGAEDPAQSERAARDSYEAAVQWARRRPSEARAKYYSVWQRYPDTAYGLLARLEAADIDRQARPVPDKALEDLLNAAEAAEGVVDDDTANQLRTYAEDHQGTLAGERAHLALVRSQAVRTGRFDADLAALDAAIAKKDWREAMSVLSRVSDYAPLSMKDQLLARRRTIEDALNETRKGSAGGPPAPTDPATKKGPEGGTKTDEADRNRKAEEVFRSGQRLMDGGKEIEALDAFLTFLREYRETPNGVRHEPEARGRIATLTTGPAGIAKLFRGKTERADKGRWRISYDFSDAEQLKDFVDVLAFESPPRATWKADNGAVKSTRGSGAFVLDAVFLPDEVSVSVSVTPDKPHDLGVMFMDPSEQRRFYLFTLQNTFFKLGKGDAAQPFLENAVVLFGPNMWRDTPPGTLGFVRKCGSDEPQVRPNEPVPIRAGKSGAEVWMKFEGGRSIRGSAYGDTKYDFPGVTPGVFVLQSGGYFDDFVVEGALDVDWVQKRWRAILANL
jgi:hypothetical protein